jgi:hypothetical protein
VSITEIDVDRESAWIEESQIRALDDADLQALLTQTRRKLFMAVDDDTPAWLVSAMENREKVCQRELDWRIKAHRNGGPAVKKDFSDRIAKIKLSKSIAEVVAMSGVALRHSGYMSYKGLCPFHEEKTASFTCWQDTNTWRCFGCGEHGDALDYVQQWQGIDLKAAMEFLEGRGS